LLLIVMSIDVNFVIRLIATVYQSISKTGRILICQ